VKKFIVKKSVASLALFMTAALPLAISLAASPAYATDYKFNHGQPSIEIDLSVLDQLDPPTPPQQKSVPQNTAPLPFDQADEELPLNQNEIEAVPLEAIPVPSAPSHKARIIKPAPKKPVADKMLLPPPLPPIIAPAQKPAPKHTQKPAPKMTHEAAPKKTQKPEPVKKTAAPLKPSTPKTEAKPAVVKAKPVPLKAEPYAVKEVQSAPLTSPPPVAAASDVTLTFDKLSSTLSPDSEQKLNALLERLSDPAEIRLQIRAYASGEDGSQSSARRMALSRGLMVRSYLMDKGIKPTRVDVRAMGSETDRNPLDRVDLVFVQ
jgi:outer membrane protein OmpA-like peptidoglycan-associated protein